MEVQLPFCGRDEQWCSGSCMGWCMYVTQRAEKAGVSTMAVPVAET